jgi:hypothetical protein
VNAPHIPLNILRDLFGILCWHVHIVNVDGGRALLLEELRHLLLVVLPGLAALDPVQLRISLMALNFTDAGRYW